MTQDTEKLRIKNQTKTQSTVEGHSSRVEQMEDRISEFEDKIEIKEKTDKMLSNSRPVKEYTRMYQLYQKTKPENHGY
jgi:hypothetical protein